VICSEHARRVDNVEYPPTAEAINTVMGGPPPPGVSYDEMRELGRGVWSYLSGISHGFSFALMQSALPSATPHPVPDLVTVSFGLKSDSVNVMGYALAGAAVTGCGRFLNLMGWAGEPWTSSVERCVAGHAQFMQAAEGRLG
jgi:hypothetical protein